MKAFLHSHSLTQCDILCQQTRNGTPHPDFVAVSNPDTPSLREWVSNWLRVRPYTVTPMTTSVEHSAVCEPLEGTNGSDWSYFWATGAEGIFSLLTGLHGCSPLHRKTREESPAAASTQGWDTWVADLRRAFQCMIQMYVHFLGHCF